MLQQAPEFESLMRRLQSLNTRVYLSFSGGCDSTVLLHLLVQRLPVARLRAVYVNHGWSESSDCWERQCGRYAAKLNVPYTAIRVDARRRSRHSPEAIAREVRYAALKKLMGAGEALLTAHHREDQAATILLRLLRGTGPQGLAGMSACAEFGKGYLMRPLLNVSVQDIRSYARMHDLQWIDDDSNTDDRYDRNYLCMHVAPLLSRRWPGWHKTFARAAAHQAELAKVVADKIAPDYAACIAVDETPPVLSAERLASLEPAVQKQVLRHWFKSASLPMPKTAVLNHLARSLMKGQRSGVLASWARHGIHIYRGRLHVVAANQKPPIAKSWPLGTNLELPELNTVLLWDDLLKQSPELEQSSQLSVRFRTGGERCGHKSAKNIFQEYGCPPWLRARTPLIYSGKDLRLIWNVTACNRQARQ